MNPEPIKPKRTPVRIVPLVLLLLVFVTLGVTVGLGHKTDADETQYHMPATLQYMQQFPHLDLKDYHSASGPFPYVLLSFWARIFGPGMLSLRVAIMIFGMLSLVVLWRLMNDESLGTQLLVTLFVFFHPYFLFRSFSLYTVAPATFFGLLSLLLFRQYQTGSRKLLVLFAYVLSASAAVLSRQEFLSYPLGVAIFALASKIPWAGRVFPQKTRYSYSSLALMFVPVVLLGLLILYWGGSNPPRFAGYFKSGPIFRQLDFVFLFLGFWYWPLFLDNIKLVPKWLFVVAFVIGIHLFFVPLHRASAAEGGMGVVGAVYTWLINLNFPLSLLKATQFIVWLIGVMVFSIIVRRRSEAYALIAVLHFLIMLSIPFVWERFYFAAFPAVWFAVRGDIHNRKLYVPLVIIQVVLSIQYFVTHI